MKLSRGQSVASWVLQVAVAVVLFQTLFFKFTGAEESKYIFGKLGLEPWGRLGSGVVELVAVVLLLYPRTATIGAAIALGVISGAIVSHLTRLGIVVKDDGGVLFGLAVGVFVGSLAILVIRRGQIPVIGPRLVGRPVAARPAEFGAPCPTSCWSKTKSGPCTASSTKRASSGPTRGVGGPTSRPLYFRW